MEQYYCPLSARIAARADLERYAAKDKDLEPQPWKRRFDQEDQLLEEAARALNALDISRLDPDPDASDACMLAGTPVQGQGRSGVQAVLASRFVFNMQDLLDRASAAEVYVDLMRARAHPDLTGVVGAAVRDGRVFVALSFRPSSAHVEKETDATTLLAALRSCHVRGLVHGGLNERWLNPRLFEFPIFGFGLAGIYAAWRRKRELKLGLLRADPRYASLEELTGLPGSESSDVESLVKLLARGRFAPDGDGPWRHRVNGPDALMEKAGVGAGQWTVGPAADLATHLPKPIVTLAPADEQGFLDAAEKTHLPKTTVTPAPKGDGTVAAGRRTRVTLAWAIAGLVVGVAGGYAIAHVGRAPTDVTPGGSKQDAVIGGCDARFVQLGLVSRDPATGRCEVNVGVGKCGTGTVFSAATSTCEPRAPSGEAAGHTPPAVARETFEFVTLELNMNSQEKARYARAAESCAQAQGKLTGTFAAGLIDAASVAKLAATAATRFGRELTPPLAEIVLQTRPAAPPPRPGGARLELECR